MLARIEKLVLIYLAHIRQLDNKEKLFKDPATDSQQQSPTTQHLEQHGGKTRNHEVSRNDWAY